MPLPDAGGRRPPQPDCLTEDGEGRLWVGTAQQGAFVIPAAGGTAQPVRETEADPAPLARQQVSAITEVRPGEVWIGTVGQGIVDVDVASGRTRRIRNVPAQPLSLADNVVLDIHRDRSGLVWVASNHGVSRYDPREAAILTMFGDRSPGPSAHAGTEVSWILELGDGRLWLGTQRNGVEIVDPERGIVGALPVDAAHPLTALPDDMVTALERVADGSVFIATKRGLYHASADGRRVARVTIAGRSPQASTWALLADGPTLWIGGQSDGLWRMDWASGRTVPALPDPEQRLSDARVFTLARGAGGVLWVGTRHGLDRLDPGTGRVERIAPDGGAGGLGSGFVTSLFTDREQRLWVGTYGGGIDLLADGAGPPRVTHLGRARGLPNENVNAIVDDPDGRIWVSTDDGLAVIDAATLAVRALQRADGVVFPIYWTGAATRTAEGELLFGGAGGMTIVRPQRLQPWTWRPPLVVTELEVGGQRVPAARFVGPHPVERTIVVPADANSLSVEFAAIDYSAPERNRYSYRLEGYDRHWIDSDATRRLASYTNLPPGRYRLLLRGSNRDGVWSDGTLALAVHVLPAWHQTLWFRGLVAAAALLLVLALVRWRTRLLRLRQGELERKVGERTAELEAVSQALAEKSRILERISITDPLTGLHNRRFLTEHIDGEIAASLRRAAEPGAAKRSPVDTDNVFFVVDVDHFKRVNDRHGHAAGDAVLVQFGHRLRALLRESDHLVRWGGEEFLVVARDTDLQRAEELAERMRAAVAEAPFVADDGTLLGVTCSIGFASLPFVVGQPRALGWGDVVRIADLALLAAKRAGRNGWVGIAAGAAAHAEGLLERLVETPLQALHDGEIVVVGSQPLDVVVRALQATDGDGGRNTAAQPLAEGG